MHDDAVALDCLAETEHARVILKRGTSAHQQLDVYQAARAQGATDGEALSAVVGWLARTTCAVDGARSRSGDRRRCGGVLRRASVAPAVDRDRAHRLGRRSSSVASAGGIDRVGQAEFRQTTARVIRQSRGTWPAVAPSGTGRTQPTGRRRPVTIAGQLPSPDAPAPRPIAFRSRARPPTLPMRRSRCPTTSMRAATQPVSSRSPTDAGNEWQRGTRDAKTRDEAWAVPAGSGDSQNRSSPRSTLGVSTWRTSNAAPRCARSRLLARGSPQQRGARLYQSTICHAAMECARCNRAHVQRIVKAAIAQRSRSCTSSKKRDRVQRGSPLI